MSVQPNFSPVERSSLNPGLPAVDETPKDEPTRAQVTEGQRLINQYFGSAVVPTTGINGKETRANVARFQRAEGLTNVTSGTLDEATLTALRQRAPAGYGRAQQDSISRLAKPRTANAPEPGVGSPLAMPAPGTHVATRGTPHTVRAGETIDQIAQQYGITRNQLLANNPGLVDPKSPLGQIAISDATLVLIPPAEARSATQPNKRRGATPTHYAALPQADNTPRQHPGAWTNAPEQRPRLERNALTMEPVRLVKERLQQLGFDPGTINGRFDAQTQEAVRLFQVQNNIQPANGVVNDATWAALQSGTSNLAPTNVANLPRYNPGSPEQVKLFQEAAALLRSRGINVPDSWASSHGLQQILRRESNGQVGRPNYTYGARARNPASWASVHAELQRGVKSTRSSATGLGQLLLANVDKYYPAGRAGIGNPVQEAAGMMAYILDRYRTPERAWSQYGKRHEGY